MRRIITLSLGPICAAVLSFFTLPLTTWYFSVTDVGNYALLQLFLGLSINVFSLALHQAYVREYFETADKEELLLNTTLPGFTVITISIAILYYFNVSISMYIFNSHSNLLNLYIYISLYSIFLNNAVIHVLRMQQRSIIFSILKITPKLVYIMFILANIAVFNIFNYKFLVFFNTVALVLTLLLGVYFTLNSWIHAVKKPVNFLTIQTYLKFSLPLTLGGLAHWGFSASDRFMLRILRGVEDLGLYAAVISISAIVALVATVFSTLWHPALYYWVKNGLDENDIKIVVKYILCMIIIIWTIFYISAPYLILLLPAEYLSMQQVLILCISFPLIEIIAQVSGVGLGIKRKSIYVLISVLCGLVVNVGLNFVLIPQLGPKGAAIASLVGYFVFFIVRTELGCSVWIKLSRLKIYIIMFIFSLMAICVNFVSSISIYFDLIWYSVFCLTLLFLRPRRDEVIKFVHLLSGDRK